LVAGTGQSDVETFALESSFLVDYEDGVAAFESFEAEHVSVEDVLLVSACARRIRPESVTEPTADVRPSRAATTSPGSSVAANPLPLSSGAASDIQKVCGPEAIPRVDAIEAGS
jgi:hypothetical protein